MNANYFFRFSIKLFFLTLIIFTFIFNNTCSQWNSLGTGANNDINALVVYNNELIVGGDFTSAGGIAANRIAKWNTTTWFALGLGTNGSVNALAVFNGELIVAGNFTQVGGVGASRIAKWNGSNWNLFGNNANINDEILALAVYNNELYV